jgi:uncharacterized protein (DUF1501 family)
MKMRRRDFLNAAAVAPLALAAPGRLFAAPAGGAKLLVVFLRGGYDAANLLVPISSDFYYEVRKSIAVPRPGSEAGGALAIDADWALHPALATSLMPLVQKKQAAFIPFAGTDDVSRSHFETQDSIELGQPLAGERNFQSGFLNRLVAVLSGNAHGMSFTDQLPLVFRGEVQVPNMALRNLAKPGVDARQTDLIRGMYQGTPLEAAVNEGFSVRDDVMRDMAGEMEMANRNAITTRGFELEARRIAKMMAERYDVGFVDVGGWDTHVGEGGANGYLATRLDELSRGLAAFADEMGPRWSSTVVVVVSEFGRTFRENGNRGTDHGHGTVYWILGGSVNGGGVMGEQVRVERATLFQDRDYPVLNEYRAVIGGILARMYGLSEEPLRTIFPQARPRDLALL